MLVMGASGAGKTWNLRRMIQAMAKNCRWPGAHPCVDVHGDIDWLVRLQ